MGTIEYFELEELPGEKVFHCEPLSATIRPSVCAERHAIAAADRMGKYSACRRCRVGAHHLSASTPEAHRQPAFLPIDRACCARCGRHDQRLVHQQICVSCANREYEFRKGRNARGRKPVTYTPLVDRLVSFTEDGVRTWWPCRSQNLAEALIRFARTHDVAFTDQLPGAIQWNADQQRFEYQDAAGQALIVADAPQGKAVVRPAEDGETPTTVRQTAQAWHPATLAAWLAASQLEMDKEWRFQPFICGACHHAPLQARRWQNVISCRCPSCEETSQGVCLGSS